MKYLLLLSACVLFTACGNFVGLTEGSCTENCGSSNNNSQNQKISDLNASIAGGVHDGTQAIRFNKENQDLTLILPLTGGGMFEEFQQNLPQMEGAQLTLHQPDSGVALLELKVSLETLKAGIPQSLDETDELPNGSPIPGFKDQIHGYLDIEVLGTFVRIYVSEGHLGLYMVSAFDPYVMVSYPLLNSDNQVLGYFSQIPSQAHFDGAFFISLSLSENSF